MESLQGTSWSRRLVLCAIAVCLTIPVQAADKCAEVTWLPGQFEKRALSSVTSASSSASSVSSSAGATSTANATVPITISHLITDGNITAGQVNCRYTDTTEDMDINYYTCTALATKYGISVETFFLLNPDLKTDCSNVQADTDYCVQGFIEPVRATAGLCGPPNGNATCLGTAYQCCNANTFTCGNSTEDCADGTCYEGACAGDAVFTTDGKCGSQHGYKQCAGVWGDCCNADGECGTGADYCGYGVCQLGNCTIPSSPSGPPSWLNGNTTDGTCGGADGYTCNVVYGNCCNKDGVCGSLPSDCGAGCQPQYGNCSSSATGSSSSSTTSSSSAMTTTSSSSTPKTTSTSTTPSTTTPATTTAPSTVVPGESDLPACGQTCFNNMLAQYSTLGCASPQDSYCLCNNADFGNGLRDCSNGACGTDAAAASSAIAFGSAYCAAAFATHTATTTGLAALPSCGQTCFSNVVAQYSALGCASPVPSCLCENVNFGYGLRDCADGACGTAVASTVIAYGSSYCASATAAP